MSDDRRNPLSSTLVILAVIGSGWYFLQNFQVSGLDGVSIRKKGQVDETEFIGTEFISYGDQPAFVSTDDTASLFVSNAAAPTLASIPSDNPFQSARQNTKSPVVVTPVLEASSVRGPAYPAKKRRERFPNLRIGSWALDGFGNSKLADDDVRRTLVRVIRQFDIVALQQISAIERDVIPLLVDACNSASSRVGELRYDFVLGEPIGPSDAREQLAFIYDTDRIRIDRNQTYTVGDPSHQMTYDPLVVWCQASEPDRAFAWTFSLVNVRVDLGRAPTEVGILPSLFRSIRRDGRGEDDVVMAGLFQADDAYLLPSVMGTDVRAAVKNISTEIMGKHQTSNILCDIVPTNEFVGRGGALDFLRIYNLSLEEASAVSNQLPIFAEFSANEGGPAQ